MKKKYYGLHLHVLVYHPSLFLKREKGFDVVIQANDDPSQHTLIRLVRPKWID